MKKVVKKLKKTDSKSKTIKGKKKSTLSALKKKKPPVSENTNVSDVNNPSHRFGHRKLNIIENFPEHSGSKVHLQESAVNNMANSDRIKRTNSSNRKVITGATIGKTGRIIVK